MKGVTISTFGGNPVVTTAAKAVIDYIEEQNLLRNTEETGAYLRGKPDRTEGQAPAHRRRARHGPAAGHRTGGRPQDQNARHRSHAADDGSRARKPDPDRPRRHLRQRAAPLAAHEHRPRRRGRIHPPPRRQFARKSRPRCSRAPSNDARTIRNRGSPICIRPSVARKPRSKPIAASTASTPRAPTPAPRTSTCRASSRRSPAAICAARALTILDANILGASCARVCPVDVLCEGACVMHRYNREPIEIGRLQRFAMDASCGAGACACP